MRQAVFIICLASLTDEYRQRKTELKTELYKLLSRLELTLTLLFPFTSGRITSRENYSGFRLGPSKSI